MHSLAHDHIHEQWTALFFDAFLYKVKTLPEVEKVFPRGWRVWLITASFLTGTAGTYSADWGEIDYFRAVCTRI